LIGTVESFARQPPTPQATMAQLKRIVTPGEFGGTRALVVGGSRGLGELTAKLIAAGGGRVVITYVAGETDARQVADEINIDVELCSVIRYDVREPATAQLAALGKLPTSLYYMATPAIFRRKSGVFVTGRFAEFLTFYEHGFWYLCDAIRQHQPDISVFYPSFVAVDDRPANMTEYAMTKVAGEMLCDDMNAHLKPIRITTYRLPRLPTDQTATLRQVETPDTCDIMLPIIRRVEAPR
jgi:NAD(P)-dependent dehydrogenase (short-subunit alcohol dehydrogenase family)